MGWTWTIDYRFASAAGPPKSPPALAGMEGKAGTARNDMCDVRPEGTGGVADAPGLGSEAP